MTSVDQYVELSSDVRLPYVEQGDPSGTPVLLLHGFLGSWREFRSLLSDLPSSLHVFAITQRGHGKASKPAADYNLVTLASDAAAFLDALQIKRAVIVGHSMGGAVAQRLALDHSESVLGLGLVGTCVIEPGGSEIETFYESTISKLSDPIEPAFVRRFLGTTLAHPSTQSVPDAWVKEALNVPAHVWKATWKGRLETDDASDELSNIEVPTLIVWGDQDTRCPRRHQDAFVEEIPTSRLIVYEGAGHNPHLDAPRRFISDLVDFVVEIGDRQDDR
jgi:pimeloyl-ACP methyl ester carboxylesterase